MTIVPGIRDPFDETVLPYTGIKAVACQDYAGAFSCGARQEGFEIVGKFEQKDKFGMKAWLHNADCAPLRGSPRRAAA